MTCDAKYLAVSTVGSRWARSSSSHVCSSPGECVLPIPSGAVKDSPSAAWEMLFSRALRFPTQLTSPPNTSRANSEIYHRLKSRHVAQLLPCIVIRALTRPPYGWCRARAWTMLGLPPQSVE
ncbi:hypothetical protein TcG_10177 [Trypanosoma cruzi]|nr:hypothetical protein TcG_10177 [Trypanosoma cruzi]